LIRSGEEIRLPLSAVQSRQSVKEAAWAAAVKAVGTCRGADVNAPRGVDPPNMEVTVPPAGEQSSRFQQSPLSMLSIHR
jgi:hypothetical protein